MAGRTDWSGPFNITILGVGEKEVTGTFGAYKDRALVQVRFDAGGENIVALFPKDIAEKDKSYDGYLKKFYKDEDSKPYCSFFTTEDYEKEKGGGKKQGGGAYTPRPSLSVEALARVEALKVASALSNDTSTIIEKAKAFENYIIKG